MVSLPQSWIKKHHVKKGDEVDIEEREKHLRIEPPYMSHHVSSETTIDISSLHERVIRWFISSLHKLGYDIIKVRYATKEQRELLQELTRDLLLGFIISDETEHSCTLRSISTDLDEELEPVLRRAFLVTLALADESLQAFHAGPGVDFQKLLELEKNNNQLTNFCERILNKKTVLREQARMFLYVIAWNLEKIADDYKYICQAAMHAPKALSTDVLAVYGLVNEQLRDYYALFYKFSLEGFAPLVQRKEEIATKIKSARLKNTGMDLEILRHLHDLSVKLSDFSSSMIPFHHLQALP